MIYNAPFVHLQRSRLQYRDQPSLAYLSQSSEEAERHLHSLSCREREQSVRHGEGFDSDGVAADAQETIDTSHIEWVS